MNLLAIQRFYQSADLGSWQHQLDGKRPSHRFEEVRQLRGHKDGTPTTRQLDTFRTADHPTSMQIPNECLLNSG
jgi:hypothetical protein